MHPAREQLTFYKGTFKNNFARNGRLPDLASATAHIMPVALDNNTLPINSRLEEYVIQSVLGVGGFGITYLARHHRTLDVTRIRDLRG